MSGYVSNSPKGYRNKGVEPVDIGAQRWAEYPDLPPKAEDKPNAVGCTFTKPCKLPDGVINYASSTIPTDAIKEFGEFALLGGRETDASGNITLGKISGNIPASLGTLALGGRALASAGASCGGLCTAGAATGIGTGASVGTGAGGGATVITAGVAAGALAGMVALLWPSSLGDSSLYTPEQLKVLKEGRTRVRLHIEQQADGTLKGYGYNTEKRTDWEMIPVVEFVAQGSQQVADFGDGVTLIWTPAVDPSSTSGIPPLEAAPQTPHIWIYPPTEQADSIIVNPIYPPEYKDFILVFPIGSGVQPLYIVINVRKKPGTVTGQGQDVTGIWLAGAGAGLGAPIPTRIADQLRGQKFKSFDDFRAALWTTVGNDPELLAQFKPTNQGWLAKGNSPFVPKAERNGKNGRYELHHIEHIQHGGAVYDVDNLSVATPKRHAEIHKEDRQKS
ncbi:S-type pyocin family protein [Pseudomonas chlororaphis subsp. aurantiaca]|uniref:S-type pyocin domain-containing protein n=1 Tax=Pseudomonas chlororaphis TaxID=587753 RepID=UPI000865B1CA|nr:S-type pyocin domain-containing protein [Pseudomonas chlororaphis]BAV74984.1 S-type pyocin family protein [Pseudomonas chlororaphis subsp. aurantiaca]